MFQHAFSQAAELIWHLDQNLLEIVFLSLGVTGSAITLAACFGLAIVIVLDYDFPGHGIFVALLNTLTGLPPVVVGLLLYLTLSRSGPLGSLNLLYSPAAMMIAQTILATPIVAALSYAAVISTGSAVRATARCLGASDLQACLTVFLDARYAIMAAIAAAFGRVMAEVGAVLMVGGNISHHTRTMTTTIAMEADKGDFALAIALGIILLLLSFVVNGALYFFQRKGRKF